MSTLLSVADYNQFSNEFPVISSIDKSMGANIGAVWRDILSLGDDTSSKVKGFLSRGENVYALVSDRYEDNFNLLEWVSQRLSFRPKVAVNALNYSLVFGKGVLPRSSEEVLSEIRSVRGVSSNEPRVESRVDSYVQPSSYATVGATSVLSDDFFVLNAAGISFEVYDEGDEYILGRSPECDFVISDGGVSATHCKLKNQDGTLQIFDLGSTNGIRLNKKRIRSHEWVVLREGDSVKIGRITLKVSLEEG